MVIAKVKDPKTKEVFEYYVDGWLYRQLHNVVIPTLKKKDEDYVFCIDGEERIKRRYNFLL